MSDFFLIVLVIFLLFSVFRRYIFFFVINALTKGLFKKMEQQQRQQQQNFDSGKRPDGQINVEDSASQNQRTPSPNRDRGDYVDYEEIKD